MPETQEIIQDRINSRLTIDANLLEGGFSQDIIGSVSYELANIQDIELDSIADKCFVKTAPTMEDLEKCGADYGMPPRTKQSSIVNLEITGNAGAIINTNVKAIYENLIFSVTEKVKIPINEVVLVKAKCEIDGTIGNVPANTINKFLTNYEGLKTVNNPEAAYDGFDDENIETYRKRILDYLAEDATNANESQYEKWAREVTGVQKAVIKSAEVMGPGNVGVFISAINTTVSEDLKLAVYNHINDLQPINATVIVNELKYIDINISASLVLKEGYKIENVESEYKEVLQQYLAGVEKTVSYFRCSELLFNCSGVEDVTSFTINGNTDSIILNDTDYAVIGEIIFSSNPMQKGMRRK